jgi:hypothetical protein
MEQRVTIVVKRDDNDGAVEIQALSSMTTLGNTGSNPLDAGTLFNGADATEAFGSLGAKLDEVWLDANPDQKEPAVRRRRRN